MTKTCGTCKQIKPLDEFGTRRNNQGVTYPRTSCRACMAAAKRANTEVYERALAREKDARADKSAELSISGEITALIRATTARRTTPPPPPPTREELAVWHQSGCPIAPHQRRQAVA